MDAFELLKKDHQKVADLFSRIESASGQEKLRFFAQLKAELDLHAYIEETVLYPALENTDEAREITLEAYEEHNVVKDLLAQLASEATPNDEWDAKLKVLKENVEHHVEEEEGDMFGKARKALGQERIEELGLELEAEKNNPSGGEQTSAKPETRAESTEAKKESPGVLQRLASLVGLGGEPASDATSGSKKGSTTRTTPKTATKPRPAPKKAVAKKAFAKKSAGKKTVAKKTVAKKTAVKKGSGSAKSGKAAPKAAAKKGSTVRSAKKTTKATKPGAKRGSGSRNTAAQAASRAASNKRVKMNKSRQTGKSTKSKTRSR